MQDYALRNGIEIVNHGRDHKNASGPENIYNNLIGALGKLRSNMPRVPIDLFSPPGGSGISYDGHMPSSDTSNWSDTYAGQILMGHHPVATGYFQDAYYRPLDGVLRDGQNHYSTDGYDLDRSKDLVNRARDWGVGIVMMWHANNIGAGSNMSVSDFTAVLDYVAAQRDAGNILVLTMGGQAVADSSHSYRDDLLEGYTGTSSRQFIYPQFRQNIPGSIRELVATVTGVAGTSVTSTIGEQTRTFTIPSSGTLNLRHAVTIPLDISTTLSVSITGTGITTKNASFATV